MTVDVRIGTTSAIGTDGGESTVSLRREEGGATPLTLPFLAENRDVFNEGQSGYCSSTVSPDGAALPCHQGLHSLGSRVSLHTLDTLAFDRTAGESERDQSFYALTSACTYFFRTDTPTLNYWLKEHDLLKNAVGTNCFPERPCQYPPSSSYKCLNYGGLCQLGI